MGRVYLFFPGSFFFCFFASTTVFSIFARIHGVPDFPAAYRPLLSSRLEGTKAYPILASPDHTWMAVCRKKKLGAVRPHAVSVRAPARTTTRVQPGLGPVARFCSARLASPRVPVHRSSARGVRSTISAVARFLALRLHIPVKPSTPCSSVKALGIR
jgi:hypothetical protein